MRKVVKLRPGQKGTQKLLAQYGSALLCVRYRYDEASGKRLKTAEIIVEESDWTPPAPKYPASVLVALRIRAGEKEMQRQVRAAGGTWDQEQLLWHVMDGCIAGTVLRHGSSRRTPRPLKSL